MIDLTGDGQKKNTQDTNSKFLNACNVLEGVALCLKLNLESVIDNQTFFCFVVGLLLTKNCTILFV